MFKVVLDSKLAVFMIKRDNSGTPVPKPLMGAFTSSRKAQAAIDNYLCEFYKEKEALEKEQEELKKIKAEQDKAKATKTKKATKTSTKKTK